LNLDFHINSITRRNFSEKALQVFHYQARNNLIYARYLEGIKCKVTSVDQIEKIPFLPISFFKTHKIITSDCSVDKVFCSSGTTGITRSKHYVSDITHYEKSFKAGFDFFFGDIKEYTILALLPSYIEQENSSLIYMVDSLIKESTNSDSGFYLRNYNELINKLTVLDRSDKKVLLLGVSYALLELIEIHKFHLTNVLVMETGGMKGRRKELIKSELHQLLKDGFGVSEIYSEYGMTELLSQAYATNTMFQTPPWMKVLIREVEDPLSLQPIGKSGGINIIDLANINSCSFIATQDLGKLYLDGSFEVLGRFDHSDIRGCNLMV